MDGFYFFIFRAWSEKWPMWLLSLLLHSVIADELSASATNHANASFVTQSCTKRVIAEIRGSKTCGDSQ